MSVDTDVSEDQSIENAPVKQLSSSEMNLRPCQPGSNSAKLHDAQVELSSREGGPHEDSNPETINEVSLSILCHICRICVHYSLWFNMCLFPFHYEI